MTAIVIWAAIVCLLFGWVAPNDRSSRWLLASVILAIIGLVMVG